MDTRALILPENLFYRKPIVVKETAPWELFLSISSSTSQLQNAESVTKDLEHILSIRLHKSGWMKVI